LLPGSGRQFLEIVILEIAVSQNEYINKIFMKKYHFIYKITNLCNNKFYIGAHSTNHLNDERLLDAEWQKGTKWKQ
jgi:hypothetical protein